MARPKRVFTEDEVALIEHYTLNGGKNNTIASALNMPVNTLTNRFLKLLKEKRAIRKLTLAEDQTKLSKISSDMAKFLGKNELGQVDKQTIVDEKQQRDLTDAQKAEALRIASIRLHQESA